MKIIHCADIHLGSKINSLKEKKDERKAEIRTSFSKMVEYAIKNEIKVIMLSGDVFDSDRPSNKDKKYFQSIVSKNENIDFLYLKGNHDLQQTIDDTTIPNLKLFGNEWTTYSYGDIDISGIELTEDNSETIYSSLNIEKNKKNIVMLHGDIRDGSSGNDVINKSKLKNKNIDYLALGHIHSYSENNLDDRGIYVYSGCLEGRGFDELGKKGFVVLDVNEVIEHKFIPFCQREILIVEIDVSGANDIYDVTKIVKDSFKEDKNNIFKVILKGDLSFEIGEITSDVKSILEDYGCYYYEIEDKTKKKINIDNYKNDTSLKGEFVRTVLSSNDISDEDKQDIIILGIKTLERKQD